MIFLENFLSMEIFLEWKWGLDCKKGMVNCSVTKIVFSFIIDFRQGPCYKEIKDLRCQGQVSTLVCTKELCCATVGKAWGLPCERCPTKPGEMLTLVIRHTLCPFPLPSYFVNCVFPILF